MLIEKFAKAMSKIFNRYMSINSLFIQAGLENENLPIFNAAVIPYEYWKEVFRSLAVSSLGRQQIIKILDTALHFFSENQEFREIRNEMSREA